ncbi:AraC family transcriptional regulator [Nocardiopsis sp. MG754419]|uniref:AraC family transcriptional regulator n=1 Tax=Nocardiopsis sp. MG754419 TaxID=2259865 RepID=UPI001BA915DD|nr:AraC family transcriptional regulator [Nocardiopsis sp. MG754419]MBR8743922.1 AraC family transcriptional regulator [Nocardiopsis sp. MG754419]
MDLLSDVVTSMRSGTPGGARVEMHGTWGWYLPGDPEVAGFMAVLAGVCHLFPDGADEPLRVVPGDLVFSPHGGGYGLADTSIAPTRTMEEARPSAGGFHRHTYGTPDDRPPVAFVAGGYRMDRARTHSLLTALPAHIHIRESGAGLTRVLAELGEETATSRPGGDALLPLLLDTLLVYILRACLRPTSGAQVEGWARALDDPGIGAALASVHRDPAHPWSVDALARTARMSRATFTRRFAALTGMPPMSYVSWWRMNTARGLLRDTDLSVEQVASRVGYSSPFAFSHAFRRGQGTSPLRFRGRRTGRSENPLPP